MFELITVHAVHMYHILVYVCIARYKIQKQNNIK